MNLEDKIDLKKVITTIKNLNIEKPSIIETYMIEDISILKNANTIQLIYDNNGEFQLGNIYLAINEYLEIVLDAKYNFHAFNVTKDDVVYSYDQHKNLINSYLLQKHIQNEEIFIIKSNTDIYYKPTATIFKNSVLNNKRINWKNSLLCWSEKMDGRFCFYIRIKKKITYFIKKNIFS